MPRDFTTQSRNTVALIFPLEFEHCRGSEALQIGKLLDTKCSWQLFRKIKEGISTLRVNIQDSEFIWSETRTFQQAVKFPGTREITCQYFQYISSCLYWERKNDECGVITGFPKNTLRDEHCFLYVATFAKCASVSL